MEEKGYIVEHGVTSHNDVKPVLDDEEEADDEDDGEEEFEEERRRNEETDFVDRGGGSLPHRLVQPVSVDSVDGVVVAVVGGGGVKGEVERQREEVNEVKNGGLEERKLVKEDTCLDTLEAKEVYILMSKEYRISRNRRAEWFFSHVNTCLPFPPDEEEHEEDGEGKNKEMKNSRKSEASNGSSDFEVVSIIPLNPPREWSFENRHGFKYHVNPSTVVTYLSRRYRIVFCLDISPSIASVDVQAGGVIFDCIFKALQASLHGLLQPFEVPGSKRMFRPEIFITVIAHTPFFTPVTDQVLIQGHILDSDTCDQIIKRIFDRLNDIENRIARIIGNNMNADGDSHYYNEEDSVDGDVNEGVNLDETFLSNTAYTSLSMNPDFGLLDLLRQALIALSLMPENSSAGLVILTDGVISVPDGRYLDIILSQLRYNTVSCSFIQLSSPFHPHLCHGVLPYADLMKFVASATFGAFLSEAPDFNDPGNTKMNVYHMAFLAWSFQKTLETEWTKPGPPANVKPGEWSVRNKCFFSVRDMPIVKKQQYENTLHVDHMKVMSCRLREGFTIKEVITTPESGLSEVTLILPWKFLIHLEYKILINSMDFDDNIIREVDESGYPSKVRCVVSLEGPYDFLHDVTCLSKKPFSSLYRQLMVNRFWATRKNLSESDRLLVHLNSFSSNPAYYTIPESLKNGVHLFNWGSGTSTSATQQLQSNEQSFPQFTHFWKPVCLLDTTVWQKWMHTHRIGVILEHDYPLPKHLHLPNSAGRFNVIQCRQAVMALNTLLKNMSSFVLLENQSYVYLMFKDDDKVPYSFCLVRVTSKPPHVVLRLAFLVGTPGHLRHRTVATFREKIAALTYPQRVKDPPKYRVIMNPPAMAKAAATASPLVNKTSWSEMPCCVIVQKPVEKILIRYEKSPEDFRRRLLPQDAFFTSYVEGKSSLPKQSTFGFRPTYQAPWGSTSYQMLPEVFNTIARYLQHKRWIWWFPGGELPPLSMKWASEILATVTKMRLQEGFRFAYSSSGITNMVLELPMKNDASKRKSVTPMVLQFVVFPPTSTLTSDFEGFDSFDAQDSLFVITECWVEPQCGAVVRSEDHPDVSPNFFNLDYTAIPKLMFETDHKCISLVGTFEYLVRICSHKAAPFLISVNQSSTDKPAVEENESIEVIPFEFDLKQILMRSGQVEILFSSFFQDLSLTFPNEWNSSVCSFFERANNILYQQWCINLADFQDKEVQLSQEQHQVATRAVLQRKGIESRTEWPSSVAAKGKGVQWRCFVRSSSNTHVLVTLVPASLKDVKLLLLQLENMDSVHKTRCSRYVEFLDLESGEVASNSSGGASSNVECPNQLGPNIPATSSSSTPMDHVANCQSCLKSRKRVRAFSGGECAPAIKKYLVDNNKSTEEIGTTAAPLQATSSSTDNSADEQISQTVRSQTFSEGTVSGKLAQFMRAKRTLSDKSDGELDDNVCSDPQRCSQLNDYLSRAGVASGADDSLRYVPCRTPIIGSLAFCVFTYSCSLLSLTDHVIFKKLSKDEMTKDFRVNKPDGNADEDFEGEDDDDDDLSSTSGSIFPNGRSVSQESFSESSLQRLEIAEHEDMLKAHCTQMKQAHLQAYIWSAYRSLLSCYPINPSDINVVIEKCCLTRVQFPLHKFLQYVCRHDKEMKDSITQLEAGIERQEDISLSSCTPLESIHHFIQKRFRRLLSRNFSPTMESGHVLYFKIANSNAFSDVSALGMVKCSSDLEDNMDSFSVVADSLCSVDEPLPSCTVLVVSDNETNEKSSVPRSTTATQRESTVGNEEHGSIGGITMSSCPPLCFPLFSYLTCRFHLEGENGEGDTCSGYIPLTDIPTCYYELTNEYMKTLKFEAASESNESGSPSPGPPQNFKLTMELTFLTAPSASYLLEKEFKVESCPPVFTEGDSAQTSENSGNNSKLLLNVEDFKDRLSLRQAGAIDHIMSEIEWLMEDEVTSFRSTEEYINAEILEKIASHVEKSIGKPGCTYQKISLTFVEHSDNKGFQNFLTRFNKLNVNEYTFQQEGMWWYLVTRRRSLSGSADDKENDGQGQTPRWMLPPFWIILKASSEQLHLYHHCRYDENDLTTLTFSRNLRVRVTDVISTLIRTINQDLLLQQLHDTRICSTLLELDDIRDPQNFDLVSEDVSPPVLLNPILIDMQTKFESESDISSTLMVPNFMPGMFSCKVVWVTTFKLHSRLRSGGGKTAFARGIQTLRSTLIAFEVVNKKNMFVYRDASGNVFYMSFYRGVDVFESPSKDASSMGMTSNTATANSAVEDYPDSELTSLASEEAFSVPMSRMRRKHNDSESEKSSREDAFDGILALKVHGIVDAGEEIKDQLVQSLRNKLDDAVLDILSVTLKRNPHCKLTPEDVHFLQEPRTMPDSVIKFALSRFVSRHLPAFAYYLHQNLLQFLTMPKYTSTKAKYHFQDYSRLDDITVGGSAGEQSSIYMYNQSPGGGGTGNRGIAIVSMALTDKIGNLIRNPEWRHPEIDSECELRQFARMIETTEVGDEEVVCEVMIEFSMWKQGRINMDLLKSYVDLAIKHAGWDLIMEYKLLTAPLAASLQEDEVFNIVNEDSSGSPSMDGSGPTTNVQQVQQDTVKANVGVATLPEKRRRSSHLNPSTSRLTSVGGPEDDDEPRTRSMSFTGLRKRTTEEGSLEQARDRAPSPITLISGRGASEGSRPRVLLTKTQHQMSLNALETGEVGKLHSSYTDLLDAWVENGNNLGAPSLRRIEVQLNCRYPVRCIVQELEKIIGTVAPDNTPRQFWKLSGAGIGIGSEVDYMSAGDGGGSGSASTGGRLDSGDDTYTEYFTLKRHEKELLSLEHTEEAEYPVKILNLFRKNESFQPNDKGHACYFVSRNLAHWKSCLNCDAEFSLHSSQDFKNFYKYPPLLNENVDMDGSRGSIEKLPRVNFAKEFVLWSGKRDSKRNSLILIPRQRFLRAKVTACEVEFVVYNWSKECCERLQEQVASLSDWIQARAGLLSSLLAQKSGLFYCQPILPDNFTSSLSANPFITGDVDMKDLILNTPPAKQPGYERRGTVGNRKQLVATVKPTNPWGEFYRNIPLCNLLGMPEPVGDNPVDTHGRQLLHILNNQVKEPENTFFQYWLTRGPSASNVITTQVLESFKQAARTIHFCLTPVMFLPSWRASVAQTRDCGSAGGIIRRNRSSSRRFQSIPSRLTVPNQASIGIGLPRVRHGSEASQASSLSLRNRSRSYHSGMMNLFLPEVSEKDMEGTPPQPSGMTMSQLQNSVMKLKSDEPWHIVLCRLFLQEYMQYLQTLGFVPVHCKGSNQNSNSSPAVGTASPGGIKVPLLMRSLSGSGGGKRVGSESVSVVGPPPVPTPDSGIGMNAVGGSSSVSGGASSGFEDGDGDDEKMCHFLQRCLPGGIIVIEVGLVPPFFYCKIHALEAKRIFPKGPKSKVVNAQNAVQFVDECEKMKILTHLHSFMYDFHLRAMYLYISRRQLLFKIGYHITSFLDDFITYYPKCPNFSRNAVHIGMVTLAEVSTPSQVLFNYILGHDKYYRMKVIRMTPLNSNNPTPSTTPFSPENISSDSVNEYVLVHNMSRKVSYRDREDETQSDEFDLTLVIAHDYPTASRDFVPDYQGLRVKYYIVLTSRRDLYPKGDNEPNSGRLCQVNTPEPLCTRHLQCALTQSNIFGSSRLVPPPQSPYYPHDIDSYLGGGAGGNGSNSKKQAIPDLIREEKVRYMGYFSSHEQMMQKIIDEQKDTMEQFIRTLVTKAAVDCRRDLLWQRLLIGRQADQNKMLIKRTRAVREVKEDIISRETVGPLFYWDFEELLELVQVVPLRKVDPRLEDLLKQPITFYQTLIKVLMASGQSSSPFNYREFVSSDQQIHQLAIFTPDAHKSMIMVEVNMDKSSCDIFVVFKDGNKNKASGEKRQQANISPSELGDAMFSLVEKVVNACCYTAWTTLI